MVIGDLGDHLSWLPALARLHYDQWGPQLWRRTTTAPGLRNASQISSVACASESATRHSTTAITYRIAVEYKEMR